MSHEASRQMHLLGFFPGTHSYTLWSNPQAGSQITFESFREFASIAHEGLFDAMFLAEGLRVHESNGNIIDHSVQDRPDNITRFSALAAAIPELGLISTLNASHNEPIDVARRFATLDQLSGGRAGWNVVMASDDLIGANFRQGRLDNWDARYERGSEFLEITKRLWGADGNGQTGAGARFDGQHFQLDTDFRFPASPQGRPVIVQAGDSFAGRDFATKHADAIFTGRVEDEFEADITARLRAHGRDRADLRILSSVTVILGATTGEAEERAEAEHRARMNPRVVISALEDAWGRDLSDHDVHGPLPEGPPTPGHIPSPRMLGRSVDSPRNADELVQRWRDTAAELELTSTGLVTRLLRRHGDGALIGTPDMVAARLTDWFESGVVDGFVLAPAVLPGGLGEFVEHLVPRLQARGVFRTRYEGSTLRDHLGLPVPSLTPA